LSADRSDVYLAELEAGVIDESIAIVGLSNRWDNPFCNSRLRLHPKSDVKGMKP
jgi:hypothetical protein